MSRDLIRQRFVSLPGCLLLAHPSSSPRPLQDRSLTKRTQIGAIISYRFQEITKDQVPRFPTFVGERVDMLVAKDADVGSKAAKKKDGEDDE